MTSLATSAGDPAGFLQAPRLVPSGVRGGGCGPERGDPEGHLPRW